MYSYKVGKGWRSGNSKERPSTLYLQNTSSSHHLLHYSFSFFFLVSGTKKGHIKKQLLGWVMMRYQILSTAHLRQMPILMRKSGGKYYCLTKTTFIKPCFRTTRSISSFECLGLIPTIPPSSIAPPLSPLRTTAALLINRPLQRRSIYFLHPASSLVIPNTIAPFFTRLFRPFSGLAIAAAPRVEMGAPESAKTKVQRIIDENSVGIYAPTHKNYFSFSLSLLFL